MAFVLLQCAILSPAFKVREFSITDLIPYPISLRWNSPAGEDLRYNQPNLLACYKDLRYNQYNLLACYSLKVLVMVRVNNKCQ